MISTEVLNVFGILDSDRFVQEEITPSNTKIIFNIFKRTLIDITLLGAGTCLATAYASVEAMSFSTLACVGAAFLIAATVFRIFEGVYRAKKWDFLPIAGDTLITAPFFHWTFGVLVHEMGHALAGKVLFPGAVTKIMWKGLGSGRTICFAEKKWSFLSVATSLALKTAAGPFFHVVVSTALLVLGLYLRKSHPQIAQYLGVGAWCGVGEEIVYAQLTLDNPADDSLDFAKLWKAGLHPKVAMLGMVMVPIIATALYMRWEKKQEENTSPAQNLQPALP